MATSWQFFPKMGIPDYQYIAQLFSGKGNKASVVGKHVNSSWMTDIGQPDRQ